MLEIWGVKFHAYGLLIGLGVWLAMEIAIKYRGSIEIKKFERGMWWTVVFGVVGARLYHVVDYWQRYYLANPEKIISFWEGGLGIWGAVVGGAIGLALFCVFNKVKFLEFADAMVIGVPLAQAVGRLGNFVNGELYGKNGEPLFFYEGILNVILFGVLWKTAKRQGRSSGKLLGMYLVGYGLIRALLENLRPTEMIWKIGGVPTAVWFCLVAIVVGLAVIFRKRS